ncbi:MAG: FAD-dependent oxidoreductase, partial [Hyphomicrobiaceae bacterium]
GIVDWRVSELQRLGVEVRTNTYAEPSDVLAESPDAVIVATGGVPDLSWVDGGELCSTVWDVLGEATSVKEDVIVFDSTGRHAAVSCALHLAEHGRHVQFVTLDDNVGVEMEYSSRVVYRQRFAKHGVKTTTDHQLVGVRKSGNGLIATFRHELTGETLQLQAAQVVVENGTVPVDDVFSGLRDRSLNQGITDLDRLLARQPQLNGYRADVGFELHRIGDAVTSRGVHSAIYDALRLAGAL